MARDEVADFAPVRIGGPRRSRGPIILAAWAAGLIALVGVGLAGRVDDGGPETPCCPPAADGPAFVGAPPAEPESPVRPADPWPPDIRLLKLGDPGTVVTITRPAAADFEVATPRLDVTGVVTGPVNRLEITLEGRARRVLEKTTRYYGPLYGRPPSIGGEFSASFELPDPHLNGTAIWVAVTAFVDSTPVGGTRVRYRIGPRSGDLLNRFVIDDIVATARRGTNGGRLLGLGWMTDPIQS